MKWSDQWGEDKKVREMIEGRKGREGGVGWESEGQVKVRE